jgi:hypothetical protein
VKRIRHLSSHSPFDHVAIPRADGDETFFSNEPVLLLDEVWSLFVTLRVSGSVKVNDCPIVMATTKKASIIFFFSASYNTSRCTLLLPTNVSRPEPTTNLRFHVAVEIRGQAGGSLIDA